jgi:hypothetical protein
MNYTLNDPFVGLRDLVSLNNFDHAANVLFSAEVKHLLSLFDSTDEGTTEVLFFKESKGRDRKNFR